MPCFDLSSNSKSSDHFELIAIYKYFVYWSQKKKKKKHVWEFYLLKKIIV